MVKINPQAVWQLLTYGHKFNNENVWKEQIWKMKNRFYLNICILRNMSINKIKKVYNLKTLKKLII